MPPPLAAGELREYRDIGVAPLALGGRGGGQMVANDRVEPLLAAPQRDRIEREARLGGGDRIDPDPRVGLRRGGRHRWQVDRGGGGAGQRLDYAAVERVGKVRFGRRACRVRHVHRPLVPRPRPARGGEDGKPRGAQRGNQVPAYEAAGAHHQHVSGRGHGRRCRRWQR